MSNDKERSVLVINGLVALSGHYYNLSQSRGYVVSLLREIETKMDAGTREQIADANGDDIPGHELIPTDTVTGMVVAIQHADGTVYHHCVGAYDAARILGLLTSELVGEIQGGMRQRWINSSLSREKLEEGY